MRVANTPATDRAEQAPLQPVHALHLVRDEEFEYYFFEFADAINKLEERPQATYERITVH